MYVLIAREKLNAGRSLTSVTDCQLTVTRRNFATHMFGHLGQTRVEDRSTAERLQSVQRLFGAAACCTGMPRPNCQLEAMLFSG
jgi:hypothetical protein